MKTFVEFAALRKQVEDFSTQSIFVSKKRLSGPAITSTEATSTGIKFVGWTPSNQDATGVPKQGLEGRHVQSAVRVNSSQLRQLTRCIRVNQICLSSNWYHKTCF
jgi:hypothetical protein